MSWSLKLIGKAKNISEALEKQKFSDANSEAEFQAARPHLVGIVNQNFGNDNQVLILTASGHGYFNNGEGINRNLQVELKSEWGTLV